jgi:hypothetical protein
VSAAVAVERAPTQAVGGVVLAWMVAGAAIGVAVGLTTQVTGQDLGGRISPSDLGAALGIGCTFGMAALGALALRAERGWAADRPAVADSHGDAVRPVHVGLYALPMALAAPALLTLVVVASVAADSLAPAGVFGLGGVGMAWGAVRLLSAHRLRAALEALEDGDERGATQRLTALQSSWWSTRATRATARLNLGLLALAAGDAGAAITWWDAVPSGPGAPFARAGTAMARVLQGRLDDADAAVLTAMSDPRAHVAQGWIDAVRLLLVVRREGVDAGRSFGEQLLHGDAGELYLGLLASLRLQAGDRAAAQELVDDDLLDGLDAGGWTRAVPELALLRGLTAQVP